MARKPIITNVEIDENAIGNKIRNLIDDTLMEQIHSLFERMMEPYVPYLSGTLSQTTEVTARSVKYTQPYAHYQYVGEEFNHTLVYHPLATSYWNKAMMTNEGEAFILQVQELLRRRARELYG